MLKESDSADTDSACSFSNACLTKPLKTSLPMPKRQNFLFSLYPSSISFSGLVDKTTMPTKSCVNLFSMAQIQNLLSVFVYC